MGRTSIFEAFQAAAGFTETVLSEADKRLKEKAMFEVQDAELENMESFNQFLTDVQNSGDWRNYEKNWEEFRVKSFNSSVKHLSSPFARKVYESKFKENEMKQRLAVKGIANEKMRLEETTNGLSYVSTVIKSRAFAAKTVIGEDGRERLISAPDQKVQAVSERLNAMYDAGLIDYNNYNLQLSNAQSAVLLNEMTEKGKNLVDSGAKLEEVLSSVRGIEGQYSTPSGLTVNAGSVRAEALKEVKGYFFEKQHIRYTEGEQNLSRIYAQQIKALAAGNWDEAVKCSKQGMLAIRQWDGTHKGDGFSANVRDEYAQKFFLTDDMSGRTGGGSGGGGSAGLKGAKAADLVSYLLFQEQNGFEVKDENGNKQKVKPTRSESMKQLMPGGNLYEQLRKTDGEFAATVKAQQALDLFKNEFAKNLPVGAAEVYKNIQNTVKNVFIARFGKKYLESEEGAVNFAAIQGGILARVTAALENISYENLTADKVRDLISFEVLKEADYKDGKIVINDYVFNNAAKQEQAAAEMSNVLKGEWDKGLRGEDLSSEASREAADYLRNYVLKAVAAKTGLTNDEVLSKYRIDITNDGRATVFDNEKGEEVFRGGVILNKDGKKVFRLADRAEGEKGKVSFVPNKKGANDIAHERRIEEARNRANLRNLGIVGTGGKKAGGKKGSEEHRQYVEKLSKEDGEFFKSVRNSLAFDKDFSEGKINSEEQSKKIIKEFERAKKSVTEFEKVKDKRVPERIRQEFNSFYGFLKTGYEKAVFIDAYEYAKKNMKDGRISLVTVLEEFQSLCEERNIKRHIPNDFFIKADKADKRGK